MFHYFNAIQNKSGDALPGYLVKVLDNSTGDLEPIYSDNSGTPIINSSGIADTAVVDDNGNVSFYVAQGTYDLAIYSPSGAAQTLRVSNVPMGLDTITLATGAHVASRAALSAIDSPLALQAASLTESGREGTFVFDDSDLSTEVALDTAQGIYVPPSTDTTGASGAWVRKQPVETWFNIRHFGAVGDDVTDDYAAIQCCLNVAKLTGGTVWFPVGNYRINTGLALSLTADGSVNVRIQGTPGSWLRTDAAIDCLTISNTNVGVANTRRVTIDSLAFLVGNVSARGLVLTKAAYNLFLNLEFLGVGSGIVVGSPTDTATIHNQFTNIRPQQIGQGLYLSGQYNVVTNLTIGEGISGQYAIKFDGGGNVVDGFTIRGAGGSGGSAAILFTGNSFGSALANGYVYESYAVGIFVQGVRGVKVSGVTIDSSQTHGLQLSGTLQGSFDVTVSHSSKASAGASDNINLTNTPADNTILAQFVGTEPNLDINEATGTNNTFICGTLPNGKTINGTGTTVISAANLRTPPATTSGAGLNVPHGTAPTSPVNGDVWSTTSGLFARINGATVGPFISTVNSTAITPTSVAIGGGTVLTKAVVYTPTLTPTSVGAATVAEQTYTVTGLTTADKVIVNPPSISNATGIAGARVSAADTLAIRWVNPTAGALTPTSGTYTVTAIRS